MIQLTNIKKKVNIYQIGDITMNANDTLQCLSPFSLNNASSSTLSLKIFKIVSKYCKFKYSKSFFVESTHHILSMTTDSLLQAHTICSDSVEVQVISHPLSQSLNVEASPTLSFLFHAEHNGQDYILVVRDGSLLLLEILHPSSSAHVFSSPAPLHSLQVCK